LRPNIVLVLTDQWRGQALGYAGDPNVATPEIDALAGRSVNFVNAVSVCPVCTPHRAALLTGRYPTSTGMFLNDLYLPAEELCMAEILAGAGYDTGYIGKWHLDGHGRDACIPPERRQGFDYWKVLECTHNYNESHYYAGNDPTKRKWDGYDAYAQTDDARAYIRDHAETGRPFFLLVGYGGPHFPHDNAPEDLKALYPPERIALRPNVPPEWADRARAELQGYYAHCTAIDQCVGRLVRAVEGAGIAENTIFIFTSDHGDMFGSHGKRPRRKQLPWDESVCVPLLVRCPAICGDAGRVVRTPLTTPDILPSLLSLAGVAVPDAVEGDDLSHLLKGGGSDEGDGDEESSAGRAALFMCVAPFGADDFKAYRGVRSARHTYVRDSDGPWLLYDNQRDPWQRDNLIGRADCADVQAHLEAELKSQLDRIGDRFPSAGEAIAQWGYTVNPSGEIPYCGEFRVQSPRGGSKELCRFS